MSLKKGPYHTTKIASMSYGATMVMNQGQKCVLVSKGEPPPSGVVRRHPLLRRSVDVLISIDNILMCGEGWISDGALNPQNYGILMTHGIDPWYFDDMCYLILWKCISTRVSDSFLWSKREHLVDERVELGIEG